jgi:energy-coupling factor transport system permease protein
MNGLHPLSRILALLLLAAVVQFMKLAVLVPVGLLLAAFALMRSPRLLKTMLYRSRWLLLTMLLIFAFSTPGEYLANWPFEAAPTYEGLTSGLLQAARLIVMLAGLAWLLGTTSREDLMAGIYLLLRPLRLLGLAPERFTARLWLTLHYVEQSPKTQQRFSWNRLDSIADTDEVSGPERLQLGIQRFSALDGLLLLAVLIGLTWWWA